MKKTLRVGIVGASADRGWAKVSHVPAVQKLAGLELGAVVSSSQSKAETAAKAFGAKAAYSDAKDLFQDPSIDIVAICVKVPDHRDLVLNALAQGKHIYCEWPLGRNLAESKELATASKAAKVQAAIGLQTRMNPAAQRARDLIAGGSIGRPLSARVPSTTAAFGPKVEEPMAFAEEIENGVTLVTIQGAHTMDIAIAVLGRWEDVSALARVQYPEVEIGDGGTRHARSIADHLVTQSRMANGGALSMEVAGGRPPDTVPFRLEVTGENGELALEGGAMRGFQSGRLRLSLNGKPAPVDCGELEGMPETAMNVAGLYAALRNDILSGTSSAPDFEHAVRLTRLIESVMLSARTGARQTSGEWPLP